MRRIVPYLVYGLVTLIGKTSRIRYAGIEHLLKVRKARCGYIYAFWHQRQVFFTYTHRDLGATVLVSRSSDGGIIAETMRLSRIGTLRGSSSRGGGTAARAMTAALAAGRAVGLTPDGPKGPARKVKAGVLFLAQKSGCPILPISNAVSRCFESSKSWDNFQVPLPFSDAEIRYGAPIYVGANDDLEEKGLLLEKSLNEITKLADASVSRA